MRAPRQPLRRALFTLVALVISPLQAAVLVNEVQPRQAAAAAGVQAGDVLLAWQGESLAGFRSAPPRA